jgi:hypothetical protein
MRGSRGGKVVGKGEKDEMVAGGEGFIKSVRG